jgi:hypothetical protein
MNTLTLMDNLEIFGSSASKLSRNPLGIIALFIVLVYSIAGIVFGVSANRLTEAQLTIFILFIVGFPCLVLMIFRELVIDHTAKLYGPGDYRSDDAFLKRLSPEESRQKRREEIEEDSKAEAIPGETTDNSIKQPIEEKDKALDEDKKTLKKVSSWLNVDAAKKSFNYFVAQELALRKLESELNVTISREVSIGIGVTHHKVVDGYAKMEDGDILIEVKYIHSLSTKIVIESFFRLVREYSKTDPRVRAIVYFVCSEISIAEEVRRRISLKFFDPPTNVELRVTDLESLQKEFGV